MKISNLKIKGFRSFGPEEIKIPVDEKLVGFIGLNSAGKTTALEALRKLFGQSLTDREIFRQDFHIGKDEKLEDITERTLSIEARIDFDEEEQEAVPHFFTDMVIDEENSNPYLRLRLEASWIKTDYGPEGEIDSKVYYIKVPEGSVEGDDTKQIFPNHLKRLIQILYVPAIRRPVEQLKYASGSILFRVLKKIKSNDTFKSEFDEKIKDINDAFKGLEDFNIVQTSITENWRQFHKDKRYKDTTLGFGGSDLDSILKKLEISFSPTGTHKTYQIDELGEGYRSLFYLTLVCALLEIEEKLAENDDEENIGINRPLLTILAIEEPENHIAPQLLGRVIKILKKIASKDNSQVLLSSHTPAIVKRLNPESILHFRITEKFETEVNKILLPEKTDDAYKYVKEAVHNYPELYFARLVVIGEGDSEEVIFNRLMEVMEVDFDDNIITFAPLGHRFVNHIWRLLETLHIPYVTLLDLDVEREGGGWGRIKYALNQLIKIGIKKEELLKLADGSILSDDALKEMHTWSLTEKDSIENLNGWVDYLRKYNIFYSNPLDLDFLMLTHYPEFYRKAIPKNGGPQIPDETTEAEKFDAKVKVAIQATLKSEKATAATYSEEDRKLMIWYNYHFLGRGKPTTHIQVLSSMTDEEINANLPQVFMEVFDCISSLLKTNQEDEANQI
ncbi:MULTISPECIES: ATP-dependent nuclease [Chryseobacterium]|uniref:Nuclease n=1 Tax=Chryseobacterium indologenes TaxID=253 RepID=A0A0N0ZYU0_CHRID|nr:MULTISPECIES: AAA family ATPase [Chryseobacterium]KPE52946.1 nuclease [Chryseobacterium indologenes]PWW20137.1 putative ATP-dependent endonuclease of OLD family [Chryseobacterium sp. AG844]